MQISKHRNSKKVNDLIINALFTEDSLSKPEIRRKLQPYTPAVVNGTLQYLLRQKVVVETDDGKLTLNKDVKEV